MHLVVAIGEYSGAVIFTVLTIRTYWYIYLINLLRNSQLHIYEWTVNWQQHLLHALNIYIYIIIHNDYIKLLDY